MRKWRRMLPVGMLVLVLAAATALTFQVRAAKEQDDTIPQRVYFGNIGGGGLTAEEATQQIEAYVAQLAETKITLSAGGNVLDTTAGALGLSWSNPQIVEEAAGLGKSGNLIVRYKAMKDLEHEDKVYKIGFSVDPEKIRTVLNENLQVLDTKAVDAGLKRENGGFVIIPGSTGVAVNVEESVKVLEEYFTTLWQEAEASVELVAEVTAPRGTQEELAKVKDVLGTFHTSFADSAAGRVKNVTNGSNKIDGTVLYPGDEFSVHDATAPFTKENGYELAGAYENGQTIESYGGGICQVSTTLYNAAIRAELEIVERFAHSMIVSYVEPSMDAAIAGDYKDLKLRNNTDAPIYIESYTSGRVIYFTIYGHETRESNRKVSYVSEIIDSTDPGVEFKTVDAPIGHVKRLQGSHAGKKAKLWKIVTVNGEEVSKDVFNNSTYRASPAIYEVGVSSSNADAVANIKAAIATKDLAAVKAAAAAWSDEALAAQQPNPDPNGGATTPDPNGGATTPDSNGGAAGAGTTP